MNRSLKTVSSYTLPIVSGILIGTSYIPFPPWASFFAFVPLWIFWLRTDSMKKALVGGWITQFVLTFIGFNWVAHTVHEFGHLPWALAIPTLLAFCLIANLDVPITGFLWFFLRSRLKLSRPKSIAMLALLTAIFESWVPTLFPWNYGYTFLWAKLPIAQLAELTGFQGLSSIVILFNMLFLDLWESRNTPRAKKVVLAIVIGIASLNLGGVLLKSHLPEPDSVAEVVIAQANIGNMEKQAAEVGPGFRESIVGRYIRVTNSAFQQLDSPPNFVVWPETAYPYEIDMRTYPSSPAVGRLLNQVSEWGIPLVTGGYGYNVSKIDPNKVTNTFFILNPDRTVAPDPYFKTLLLAFGETIPGQETFPFFDKLRDFAPIADFARGPGPSARDIAGIKIGPQVCYESLFPNFSRELANQGVQMFVNLTNDSWYGTWQEPYQHLMMTLARAIEFRRPLVRATNTGVSTVVLASGEVLEMSPLEKEWAGHFTIPFIEKPGATFYQLCPWLMDVLLILLALVILIGAFRERTQKS